MTPQAALTLAIRIAGGPKRLADFLGIRRQGMYQWRNGAPAKHVVKIEEATGGLVKREQLRPDIFGASSNSEAA